MSDLQCPARVLLIPLEVLASAPSVQSVAGSLVSAVYLLAPAALPHQLDAAQRLAQQAGCRLERELNAQLSVATAIDQLADLHRGEAVVLVAEASHIRSALGSARAASGPVVLTVDSSGWKVEP